MYNPIRTLTSLIVLVVMAVGLVAPTAMPARGQISTFLGSNVTAGIPISPLLIGFDNNNTNIFPTWSYGSQRMWDTPVQWPSVNTCTSNCTYLTATFDFTTLDTVLNTAISNGIQEVLFTLGRTPPWASSNQTSPDTVCTGNGTNPGQGVGECYPPSDLNNDGSGTDHIWQQWITTLVTHTSNSDYLNGTGTWAAGQSNCPGATKCNHAHVRYFEIWNEPDDGCGGGRNGCFYHGSIAQLARMYEDARCIIIGSQGGANIIHQHVGGINDISTTACTGAAELGSVGIDTTGLIVMASNHAAGGVTGSSLKYTQNQLYGTGSTSGYTFQLPLANPANSIANAVDIINEHMKPGAEGYTASTCGANHTTLCSIETAMAQYAADTRSLLQPAELAKPFWDDEMSYCETGFFDSPSTITSCPGGATGAYSLQGNANSFFMRQYLTLWSLGITASYFYTSSSIGTQAGVQAETASQQAYNWLIGSVMTKACSSVGTVWSCTIAKGGVPYLIMWDSSQLCTDSVTCPTLSQTIPSPWAFQQDGTTASSPSAIVGGVAQIGIKPVVFSGPLTILNPACGLQPCAILPANNGVAYTFQFVGANAIPPYTWSITGSLPNGLSLTTDSSCGTSVHCKITGTPTTPGTSNVTLNLSDNASHTTSVQISITIN